MGVLWLTDFSGSTNQHSSPALLAANQAQVLVNISQTQDGSWSHRLGTDLVFDLVAGAAAVKGLHAYNKSDGTYYLHMVEAGNLRVVNEVTSAWDSQDAALFNAASTVEFANFIDKHYLIGSGATEYLSYATEAGAASVVDGNIVGKYLASNGTYLMVAGDPLLKSYWSGVAAETFDTTRDVVNHDAPATGIVAFGSGKPFVIFTENDYTIVNPTSGFTEQVKGFGCPSHRAIAVIGGHLVWPSRQGNCFYRLGPNDSYPTEISRLISNDLTVDAIMNRIAGTSWATMAAGVTNDRYLCSIGNLSSTVKGQTLNDAVVELDFAQNSWKVHTMTTGGIGSVFAEFVDTDGMRELYAGSNDTKAVYQLEKVGVYTDDNSAGATSTVTSLARTMHYRFTNKGEEAINMKDVEKLHFLYSAAGAITVKFSLDGNQTYNTLPVTLPATTAGMDWEWTYIDMEADGQCKSISLEISTTGNFSIYGVGIEVESLDNTGITGL